MMVSIVIPTYNASKFIVKALQSVFNQSYKDWELIIVDDCSTDRTIEIIEAFVKGEKNINIIKLKTNSGAAIARNKGVEVSNGKYIAFLDSDDWWHPDKLKEQIDFMEKERVKFSFTNYFLNSAGIENEFHSLKSKVNYNDIIQFNYIACSTVIYNQIDLGKQYMPNIRNRQDWALWIKLIKLGGPAFLIKKPLMYYSVRQDSISNNKLKMLKFHWYIYFHFLNLNIFQSMLFLIRNVFMHIKNKRK